MLDGGLFRSVPASESEVLAIPANGHTLTNSHDAIPSNSICVFQMHEAKVIKLSV
jgi:hypothetical protein